jgi:hypothetical protein
MKTEEEIRAQVQQWFREWSPTATERQCALLVTGYFRARGPFGVEGEEKYLLLRQPPGLKFLEWVEESADRRLTETEFVESFEQADQTLRLFRRDALISNDQPPFDPVGIVNCLRSTLPYPRRGASVLMQQVGNFTPSYSAIQQVRECFCPANWLATPPEWTPPPEAVSWARRIYEQRAFCELPILADLLEDADCPDQPLLDHCRHCPAHFRGCAALDRLLGRK